MHVHNIFTSNKPPILFYKSRAVSNVVTSHDVYITQVRAVRHNKIQAFILRLLITLGMTNAVSCWLNIQVLLVTPAPI